MLKNSYSLRSFESVLLDLQMCLNWYQIQHLSPNDSLTALREMCSQNLSITGISVLAYRLLKTGNVQQTMNYLLFKLQKIINYRTVLDT